VGRTFALLHRAHSVWDKFRIAKQRRCQKFAAVALPIVALLIRVKVGQHHIALNNCTVPVKACQYCLFAVAILVLFIFDMFIVFLHSQPPGTPIATASEWLVIGLLFSIYLTSMAFAMYPGRRRVAKHHYLRKANDELVSHCKCDKTDALISSPGQMDCPWCGCGWLFICSRCHKSFTFAEAVEVIEEWEETADRSIRGMHQRPPENGEVEEWVEFMKMLLKGIKLGEHYVYLDGWVIPTTAEGVHIEGWHSQHELDFVPQVAAVTDPDVCTDFLGWWEYWRSTALERKDT
jgi:hypothetical protein